MPAIVVTTFTVWGVRSVLLAFIAACEQYGKYRDKCTHYLPNEVCTVLNTMCDIAPSVLVVIATLPQIGSRD